MVDRRSIGASTPRVRLPFSPAEFRRRLVTAGVFGFAAGGLLGLILVPPPLFFVWNASASAPIGLYRVFPYARPSTGEMVIAETPEPARTLAARRRYIPANVPLVKRVAAARGDRVCAVGAAIIIDGRTVAHRFVHDSRGRPLPWWRGCRWLGDGEFFLLNDVPTSFDGRYFGPVRRNAIIGKAVPLWVR